MGASSRLSGAGSHGPLPTGLVDACRECGAQALELVGRLQDPQALLQAQPGLVRPPLQGILQLGQVSCAAGAPTVGQALWGTSVGHGAGQGTHPRAPEPCGPSLFPRLPAGLLGVSVPRVTAGCLPPPGTEAQEFGCASGGARGHGGQGDGRHVRSHRGRCTEDRGEGSARVLQFLKEPWGLARPRAGCTRLSTRPPLPGSGAVPGGLAPPFLPRRHPPARSQLCHWCRT